MSEKPFYGRVQQEQHTFAGLPIDHPRIEEGTKNLLRQGYPTEQIVRIIGMSSEIIQRIREKMQKEAREAINNQSFD